MPGDVMAAEMAEQPAVLRDLLGRGPAIVARLRSQLPDPVVGGILVARGSSDHAAVYGRYLLEQALRRPVALAAPSLTTLYDVTLEVPGWLAVAVSQSGETPEIVTVASRLADSGAHVVAVTNDGDSPLADVAHNVVTLGAGTERAIPATKTFTAELAAMVLIGDAAGGAAGDRDDLDALPDAVATVLSSAGDVEAVAPGIDGATGLLVTGRGFLLATALETALKLKECAGLLAQGYSTADLRHGPIAVVEREFPVVVLSARGVTSADTDDLVADLRGRGARVIEIGQREEADVSVPGSVPEPLVPIVAAVRGQQLALAAARQRGIDPDSPAGLSKVTRTH